MAGHTACAHFRLCPTSLWDEQALQATPSPAGSWGLKRRQLSLCWQLEVAFWITCMDVGTVALNLELPDLARLTRKP